MTPPGSAPPAAAAAFSAHAADYDALRRRLVPVYDAFYGAAVDALGLVPGEMRRVLDLGAGTGLMSAAVIRAVPGVRVTLLDASEAMLHQARARLGEAVEAVHVSDMAADLPAGPFDAVVSALAIHHLEHPDQRRLLGAVHERLRPRGVFVNAEQTAGPTPALHAFYEAGWEQQCRALGATEAELADTRERMRHDRCTDVPTLLRWIQDAGFAASDCIYRSGRFAVVVGLR